MADPARAAASSRVESAPRNAEEARALLQARLSLFGRVGMGVGMVFWVIAVTLYFTMPIAGSGGTVAAQTASVATGAILWGFTRRGKLSTRALETVDALATAACVGIFIAVGWPLPIWARPELIQLISVSDILVLRAFLVPSTSQKTAVFSSIAVLGVMVSTWLQYQGHRPHPDAPGPGAYVIVAGVLGLATVLITSLTSRTIFGLRQRVREASELGQYTLLERIGEGGMGIVYKARHAMLRRPTAIKLLPAERAGEHNLQRFEREVQLTSLLTHPNTVSVFDYGRTADGVLYYAMEYLDGVDLDALVSYDGPQEPGRVVHLLRQICGALGEAHAVGLVHRDVKPANVLLCSRSGSPDLVKVLDFGLVKSVSSRGDASVSTTAIDQIVGTPLYMSPEAITSPDKVDARSDLYALGALGYFLLVGEPPFSGQSAVEVCGHHLHSPPVPPFQRLGKPSQTLLDQVILRCLEKAPDARFQCALDLERALDACSDAPAWTAKQAAEWWRRHEPELKARRTQPEPAVSGTDRGQQTVAVDWRLRAG